MKYFKTENGIRHLTKKMGICTDIKDMKVEGLQILQAKADGEFTKVVYNRGGLSYTLNKNGYRREDFPALNNFVDFMDEFMNYNTAEVLVELYAIDNGRPLILSEYIHYVKGHEEGIPDEELRMKIYMGIFQIVSLDGVTQHDHKKTIKEFEFVFGNKPFNDEYNLYEFSGGKVHVLPYIEPKSLAECIDFWSEMVEQRRYEGLVAWYGYDNVVKIKQLITLDAVIIGINKLKQFTNKKMVSSIRFALMKEDGQLIHLGNASGIDYEIQHDLYDKLLPHTQWESDKVVFVKPMIVVEINVTEIWANKGSDVWSLDEEGKIKDYEGKEPFVSLRHPRFMRYRDDKTVCVNDLRIEQVPERFLEKHREYRAQKVLDICVRSEG